MGVEEKEFEIEIDIRGILYFILRKAFFSIVDFPTCRAPVKTMTDLRFAIRLTTASIWRLKYIDFSLRLIWNIIPY